MSHYNSAIFLVILGISLVVTAVDPMLIEVKKNQPYFILDCKFPNKLHVGNGGRRRFGNHRLPGKRFTNKKDQNSETGRRRRRRRRRRRFVAPRPGTTLSHLVKIVFL
jgi:hypothetical protein